jgi:hypothetical protein
MLRDAPLVVVGTGRRCWDQCRRIVDVEMGCFVGEVLDRSFRWVEIYGGEVCTVVIDLNLRSLSYVRELQRLRSEIGTRDLKFESGNTMDSKYILRSLLSAHLIRFPFSHSRWRLDRNPKLLAYTRQS